MKKIIDQITWLSPILRIIVESIRATNDGYNERFIKDPGHDFIKKTDLIIKIIATISVCLIAYTSAIHYSTFDNNEYLDGMLILFFPYIGNIYMTIALYLTTILFSFYNKRRSIMIRKINEKNKVW